MDLESLSLKELKKMAKEKGLTKVNNTSKAILIKMIHDAELQNPTNIPEEEIIKAEEQITIEETEQVVEEVPVEVPSHSPHGLSEQAQKWKAFFARTNVTPEMFLLKNPQHKYKNFIEELINHGK